MWMRFIRIRVVGKSRKYTYKMVLLYTILNAITVLYMKIYCNCNLKQKEIFAYCIYVGITKITIKQQLYVEKHKRGVTTSDIYPIGIFNRVLWSFCHHFLEFVTPLEMELKHFSEKSRPYYFLGGTIRYFYDFNLSSFR